MFFIPEWKKLRHCCDIWSKFPGEAKVETRSQLRVFHPTFWRILAGRPAWAFFNHCKMSTMYIKVISMNTREAIPYQVVSFSNGLCPTYPVGRLPTHPNPVLHINVSDFGRHLHFRMFPANLCLFMVNHTPIKEIGFINCYTWVWPEMEKAI